MNNTTNKIKIIADHYGIETQTLKACEELAELIQAIVKRSESRNSAEFDNLIEELADVKIMIEQIKYLNHIGDEIVDEVVEDKLNRQLKRIKANKPSCEICRTETPERHVSDIAPRNCPCGRLDRYDDGICNACPMRRKCFKEAENLRPEYASCGDCKSGISCSVNSSPNIQLRCVNPNSTLFHTTAKHQPCAYWERREVDKCL